MDNLDKKIPIVVIRSSDHCFLDMLRCCGIAGIPVIPVIFTWKNAGPWISEHSTYFKDPVTIPNPAEDGEGAIAALQELGGLAQQRYGQKLMLIPTSDTSQVFIQQHFDALAPYFLQMGGAAFKSSCLDKMHKFNQAELWVANDIDTPKSLSCSDVAHIDAILEEITFPCVYKPALKDITNSFQSSHRQNKAIECANKTELRLHLDQELAAGYDLVVQEKIEFTRLDEEISCYVYVDKDHEVRCFSGQHKLEEFPKPYGTGYASRFCYKSELLPITRRVAKALRWRGFLGIEFMKDRKSGAWKVIEVNMRPWLSIYFQASLGFNYVELLYRDLMGSLDSGTEIILPSEALYASAHYRLNLKLFLSKLFDGSRSIEEAVQLMNEWFEMHTGSYCLTNYTVDDPQPGIYEIEIILEQSGPALRGIMRLLLAHLTQSTAIR